MYHLREFVKNVEMNREIGEVYSVVDRFYTPKEFKELYFKVFGKHHVADNDETSDNKSKGIIKFITGKDEPISIWKDRTYFIINRNGKTHDCFRAEKKIT